MGVGAPLAGKLFEIGNVQAVAITVLIVSIFWALWIYGMRNPGLRGTIYLGTDIFDRDKLVAIKTEQGVTDIYVNETEGMMVIKYDKELLDEDEIRGMMLKEG
jgi:hypothetical protein